MLSASTAADASDYEHVAAIIFSDLTVNVEVDLLQGATKVRNAAHGPRYPQPREIFPGD